MAQCGRNAQCGCPILTTSFFAASSRAFGTSKKYPSFGSIHTKTLPSLLFSPTHTELSAVS